MHVPRFGVRTLMIAVCLVALLIWGATMGTRSYVYSMRAREFEFQERGWRQSAAKGHLGVEFCLQCADYFAELSRKYRRAMWRPWQTVAPDPHAPGFDEWVEQERRAKAVAPGTLGPGLPPTRSP